MTDVLCITEHTVWKLVSIFPVLQTEMVIELSWWWLELLFWGLLLSFIQLEEKIRY